MNQTPLNPTQTNTLYRTTMPSPVGELTLVADDTALRTIAWHTDEHTSLEHDAGVDGDVVDVAAGDHAVLARATRQLAEYFDGSRTEFDVPLAPA